MKIIPGSHTSVPDTTLNEQKGGEKSDTTAYSRQLPQDKTLDKRQLSDMKVSLAETKAVDLATKLTNNMHEAWRKGYIADNGREAERFKEVPVAEGKTAEEYLNELKGQGLEKLKVEDGKLKQDINQPAEKIVPSLAYKLNGALAEEYAVAVEKKEITGVASINSLASRFHEIWMEHNSWQKGEKPELFRDYEKLPKNEKIKDLEQLKIALNFQYPENDPVLQLFEEAYRSTN
ncbi:hypothetical protein [Endozoicomonas sp. Mp262]|uniref:hypothetical protein n=1 Tax=Endozoicomonas sp. Mp262 TaxID=2919499 RepID=UPI0021DAB3EA